MKDFSPQRTIAFLQKLAQNNEKSWFDAHRNEYQKIREGLKQFAIDMHFEMQIIDPTLRNMNPAKSLFRINRDVRFSRDKSPYKTHMGARFTMTGKKKNIAGYSFGVSADGNAYIVAGINGLPSHQLSPLRDDLIATNSRLLPILKNKKLVQKFTITDFGAGRLKTTPRGYPKDHEASDYLKMKAWWAVQFFPVTSKTSPETLAPILIEKMTVVQPFVTTLNDLLLKQV